MRKYAAVVMLGWCACTSPKNGEDRVNPPAGAPGTGGRGGTDAPGGSGGGAAIGGAGGGVSGTTGSGGTKDAADDGSPSPGSAGTTGAGSGGTAIQDAGPDGESSDATEAGGCPPPCPDSAPICSNGACRAIKQVAVGGLHACALLDDGTVRCWGDNRSRQLGDGSEPDGTTIQNPRPGAAVTGVANVEKLAAGYEHSCALTHSGEVWCWGNNRYGQLGVDGDVTLPVRVAGLDGEVAEIDCHGHSYYLSGYTCARMSSGKVFCWGANINGQLGNDTLDPTPTPTEVKNLTDARQLALGAHDACALRSTGTVVCWGYDGRTGLLGTGNSTEDNVKTPQPVIGLSNVDQLHAGAGHFCATAGEVPTAWCWGVNPHGQVGPPVGDVVAAPFDTKAGPAVEVRAGWNSSCVLVPGGDVLCWGHNEFGEFGNGLTSPSPVTSTRALLDGEVLSFDYRWTTGCALLKSGKVQCWGENYYGIIGDGSIGANALRPMNVDWSQAR
jgi:alpha-tubulin suppressor-like RCC1 family protein